MNVHLKIAALALFVVACPAASFAADTASGNDWATLAQWPDWWKGNWQVDSGPGGGNPNDKLPPLNLTARFQKNRTDMIAMAKRLGDDFNTNTKLCIPVGALRVMMRIGRVYEFLYTSTQITIIPQSNELRRVYMNRATHPADVKPSFNGDSIGHWEGETLVVETVGIHPRSEFVNGRGLQVAESSADLKMVERFHNDAPDHMLLESVATSPTALTEPYKWQTMFKRTQFPIMEEICTQNNLAIDPLTGHQTFPFAEGDKVPGPKGTGGN